MGMNYLLQLRQQTMVSSGTQCYLGQMSYLIATLLFIIPTIILYFKLCRNIESDTALL